MGGPFTRLWGVLWLVGITLIGMMFAYGNYIIGTLSIVTVLWMLVRMYGPRGASKDGR